MTHMECLEYMYKYNSEHKMNHHHHHHQYHHQYHHHYHDYHNNNQVSPRISFSNDFVDAQLQAKRQQELIIARAETASSDQSDFEFSAAVTHSQCSMISADELFFKGRLLPFKNMSTTGKNGAVSGKEKNPSSSGSDHETASSQRAITTTLREELLQGEDDVTSRPAAGKGRWKSLLGLKRAAHGGGSHSKKAEKGVVLLHDHHEAHVSKAGAQELMNEEVEFGI